MNTVNLVGRATKDAEIRTFDSGKQKSTVTMAVDGWNGKEKTANFFEMYAWEKTAETLAQYVKKGTQFGIHGELEQSTWTSDEGHKRSKIIIRIVRLFPFIGPKEEAAAGGASAPVSQQLNADANTEGLPF